MGSWVHDKVHVKSLDFFEPCAKAAKLVLLTPFLGQMGLHYPEAYGFVQF